MTNYFPDSNSPGEDRGGVRLSEHSPTRSGGVQYESTPSSSDSTIRNSTSPSDVFGPNTANQVTQHYLQDCQRDYRLPRPPKLQLSYGVDSQGTSHHAGPSNAQTSTFSAGRTSVRPERTTFATPTGRGAIEPSPGYRSTISEKDKPSLGNGKASEEKAITKMAAHCHLEGPLNGTLRASRRAELAKNHPAWGPARQVQGGIMTTQQAIRRTPGIPSNIANDLCMGLQRYAQEVNNILRQAINEVADHRIDVEYNEKVLCSNKLETSIVVEEREQLKRDIAETERKYEDMEDRLAKYHVEHERHANKVRESLAKLSTQQDNDIGRQEIMAGLLEEVKAFLDRPLARWPPGEHESGSPRNEVTALNAASIAALEQQENQHPQQQLVQYRSMTSGSREVLPSGKDTVPPFSYRQTAETSRASHSALPSTKNGPQSSYPGVFNNSRRPADNQTMSSTGWTRASNAARMQYPMPPTRPYSGSGNSRQSITSGNEVGGFSNLQDMQVRPSTAMGDRGFHPHHAFRPNAPEFHPVMNGNIGRGFDDSSISHETSYGRRRDFDNASGPLYSPTPRSGSRGGFRNFDGPSSGYNRPSPLIPQTPGFGASQHYFSGTPDHSICRQGNPVAGNSYHPNGPSQGGVTSGPFGRRDSGPGSTNRSTNTSAGTFNHDASFSKDDGGDNERYARAFEGVWGLARS